VIRGILTRWEWWFFQMVMAFNGEMLRRGIDPSHDL